MPSAPNTLTTVVIPVRDEDPQVVAEVRYRAQAYGWKVLVVDDGSSIPVPDAAIRFHQPHGYGAALKAGIQKASTTLVATMDGDGQHAGYDVKRLEDFMVYFPECAMVIGDRRLKERGIRLWGRKLLNWTATLFANRWIADLNSGLRIFRREVALGYFPILCDQFSFTTSLTMSMLTDNYYVDWLPVKVQPRRNGHSKVRLWYDGYVTLKYIVWIGLALRTRWLRRLWRGLHGRH